MDIGFHALFGLALSKQLTGDYLLSSSVFSVLPDFLGGASFQISKAKHVFRFPASKYLSEWLKVSKKGEYFNKLDNLSFCLTHSWFFLVPISIIGLILYKEKWWIAPFFYFIHLLVDLVTHEGKGAHQPFYPISRYTFHFGKSYISRKYVFAAFWTGLLVLYSFS